MTARQIIEMELEGCTIDEKIEFLSYLQATTARDKEWELMNAACNLKAEILDAEESKQE